MTKCQTCPFLGTDILCNGDRGRCGDAPGRPYAYYPPADVEPVVPSKPTRLAHPRRERSGKLRVGIASVGCYLGGAERWISDLLDHCDGSRIEWEGVDYLAAINAPQIPTVRADWLEHCPVGQGADAIRDMAERVDLMVAWGIMTAQLEQILAPGYPLIQVSHTALDEPGLHQMAGFPGSTSAACSRAALRGLSPDRRASAKVILNCVSPDRVARTRTTAAMLSEWGLPPDAKVAGWLGRISWEKRPELFIDAVAHLPEGWCGVMVGAGLDRQKAIALAERVAPGRIAFPPPALGPVGDILGAFDCHVMTTRSEACSLAAAETWLAGVPLISPRVGVLEDHPELARLIPLNPTGKVVADAILADELESMGTARRVRRAREFAADVMSPERFGREWTDFLCSKARKEPTMIEKAVSFTRAIVKHVATGAHHASPEVQAERELSCFSCSHLDKAKDRCAVCGCVAMKTKRSWADQSCPLNPPRWEAEP